MSDLAANAQGSFEEARVRFGNLLGLAGPVPERALRAALDDPLYAHHLLTCRNVPEFLQPLLANPPGETTLAPAQEQSTSALLAGAVQALWRWARTGFSTVDEATYRRRREACSLCPHLKPKPQRWVYSLAGPGLDANVCEVCGCFVARKARLPAENCPRPHLDAPGLSRWGEPMHPG